MRFFFAALVAVIFLSCSGSGNTTGGGGGSATGGSGMGGSGTGGSMASGGGSSGTGGGAGGGSTMAMVPDPGTSDQVDQDWTNVEPNNTPAQATPLGVAMGDIWTWVSSNTAGGSNTSDYFVFKSAAGPDAGTLHFDMCFGAPITSMTASLWKVSGGVQQQPALATWNSTGGCVTDNGAELPLSPSTVYLVGLTITGDAGTYSA
jgi:hypothetical protein